MTEKQNIIIIQKNNNGCGCGTLIGIILALGIAGYLMEEHGPIVGTIVGACIGSWSGIKLGGSSLDEITEIPEDQMSAQQKRAMAMGAIGLILGGIGGYSFGAEMQREMQDNARMIFNLFSRNSA